MPTVRSKRLYAGRVTGVALHYVYLPPAGTTTIVKSVFVRNAGAAGGQFAVGGELPNGSGNRVDVLQRYTSTMAAGEATGITGQWVLVYGDSIAFNLQSGGPFDVWISGAELS